MSHCAICHYSTPLIGTSMLAVLKSSAVVGFPIYSKDPKFVWLPRPKWLKPEMTLQHSYRIVRG